MVPERQRALVDIAAEILADYSRRIGISYTGFCFCPCVTSGFQTIKPSFIEALGAAMAAYPEAHVDVGGAGIVLHPARPPVARMAAVS